jgi:ABC-type Fe3+/spermidine/putrescine transport system ATPase subunit
VRVGERDLSQLPPELRSIAYVPQNYGLFPHLTIAEHLRFPIGADSDVARYWLDRLGLLDLKHRLPAALSLGQQQRVALARALVRPADLLLLDEPFSALDAPLRARLRLELRDLQREIAATTIIVTHDPEEAALLADELLVLEDGRVLQAGPTEAIFRRPAGEVVARLLGADNVGEGIAVAENQIAIEGGAVLIVAGPALRPGGRVGWNVQRERIRLSRDGRYQATIESTAMLGGAREISVRLGSTALRILAGPDEGAETGPCRLDIDPGSIQVWQID